MNWKLEEILNELILLVSANEGLNELDQSTGGDEIIEINGKQFSKKKYKSIISYNFNVKLDWPQICLDSLNVRRLQVNYLESSINSESQLRKFSKKTSDQPSVL